MWVSVLTHTQPERIRWTVIRFGEIKIWRIPRIDDRDTYGIDKGGGGINPFFLFFIPRISRRGMSLWIRALDDAERG